MYNTAKNEHDTYQPTERSKKESIQQSDILHHWETRAKRPGVQTVMSARHTLKENKIATKKLTTEIIQFLGTLLDNATIFELGVGVGRITQILAQNANRVVGCDFSETMLKKAKRNLKKLDNIELYHGKITDIDIQGRFDFVFESIVLLHILSPEELQATVDTMMKLSDTVFLLEHTYEGPDFPISKFSILRAVEEYEQLFSPFKLTKLKKHLCAGDTFHLMLFQKI